MSEPNANTVTPPSSTTHPVTCPLCGATVECEVAEHFSAQILEGGLRLTYSASGATDHDCAKVSR